MENHHVSDQILHTFGSTNLYEILDIDKRASMEQIKKAYRKAALKHHPDKGGDAEKFKAVSVIHSILSDPQKRKLFDDTGELDQEEVSDDFQFWRDYFRSLYPEVTVEKIETFSQKYKQSDDERFDILEEYKKWQGNFQNIMESVMLAEEDDEDRIKEIINDAISLGEVVEYPEYIKTSKKSKKSNKNKKSSFDHESDLANLILGNRTNRENSLNSLLSKYDPQRKCTDISDEEFRNAQDAIMTGKSLGVPASKRIKKVDSRKKK
jgi:DnaJ family protein C protein 9